MSGTKEQELALAREALWEITKKRILERPLDQGLSKLQALLEKYQITGASLALTEGLGVQTLEFGFADLSKAPVQSRTFFELASLSKTIGSCFAIEYFHSKNIPLETSVNSLLARTKSDFRLKNPEHPAWGDQVTLAHLMSHKALNMHYVNGVPLSQKMPNVREFLGGNSTYKYEPISVRSEPGTKFQYSGGGFLVLEHLIEALEGKSIQELTAPFLNSLGLANLTFEQSNLPGRHYAHGILDSGKEVSATRLQFPAFAAGAMGTAEDMLKFLQHLGKAYKNLEGSGTISHDTAVEMLWGSDLGAREFMGSQIGLGVFVTEAGDNKIALHQGANDGFRALFVYCYDGPDCGKGFVIFCNGDNKSVLMISEMAQEILKAMKFSGVNFDRFQNQFQFANLKQEEIVNLGYKNLVFSAFEPTLPPPIEVKGPKDPLSPYNLLVGAQILKVTNQKFARAENLISDHLPTFDPELFCAQGKVMDSWESARHNPLGFEILDLELHKPSAFQFVQLSTMFHDGNQAEFVRILGESSAGTWEEILPKTRMLGHARNLMALESPTPLYSKIRIEMYPDGGLSRVGLYKDLPESEKKNFLPLAQAHCQRFEVEIPKSKKPLTIPFLVDEKEIQSNRHRALIADEASAAFGAKILRASNEHYSPASQVISPFSPIHMFDGLESARSRKPGHFEEVVVELARPVKLKSLTMDFQYFVNNNPLAVSISGKIGEDWVELVGKTMVKAFAGNQKRFTFARSEKIQQLLIRTYPDGGINRISVIGE
jgi:allantoicase/CubicO group peptidase (beta-lactamase class C family)